jgi:nucleotide-binding universal stress UspA family protein/hemerythrin-like domain-containing protein
LALAMYRHLLVPLDATDLSIQVVGNAVAFARHIRARITFFHVAPDPDDAMGRDLELLRVTSPADFQYARDGRTRELLAKAEAAARAKGVACESQWTAGSKPAPAIIEAARSRNCDLIFMATHAQGGKLGMALSSDTVTVLLNAGMPVLVSSAGEPKPPERAVAVIRDDHRAMAAVVHAWMGSLAAACKSGKPADAEIMRATLTYMSSFPMAVHHPREEMWLFSRIRARTHALDAVLDELSRQHIYEHAIMEELSALVDALEAAVDGPQAIEATKRLEQAVSRYAEFYWDHMGREEAVVLPAAQEHLLNSDWADINKGFEEVADSREFRQLMAKVVAQ